MTKQVVKLPGPISAAIGSSLASLLNEVSEEIGKDLAEGYRKWRQRNLSSVAAKVDAFDKSPSLVLDADDQVPLGLIYTFVEAASKEESEEVQALWARLIISARSGSLNQHYRAIVKTLEGFTPLMALCLELIHHQVSEFDFGRSTFGLEASHFPKSDRLTDYSDEELFKALLSLEKEGLISRLFTNFNIPPSSVFDTRETSEVGVVMVGWTSGDFVGVQKVPIHYSIHRHPEGVPGPKLLLAVALTELGRELCAACMGPNNDPS